MNQLIELGIAAIGAFFLAQLILVWLFAILKLPIIDELKKVTEDWIEFMNQGIPCPSDQMKSGYFFHTKPVLIRSNSRVERPKTAVNL